MALALASLLVLVGCSSTPPTPSAPVTPNETQASDTSQNAGLESAQTAVPEANANEYGAERLHKDIGEQGGIVYPGTEDLAFAFTITNALLDPVCEGDTYMPAQAPVNGRFVELTIEVVTATDYVSAVGHELAFFYHDFTSETPDGRIVESTYEALTCHPMTDGFPSGALAPGFQQTAKFVIDVPADATSFAWNPLGDGGWEWDLPTQ